MTADVRSWRYYLPSTNGEGWGVVHMDSTGFFAAITDYGNYSYLWSGHGKQPPFDFRDFVAGLVRDPGYVLHKVAPNKVLDEAATRHTIRRFILESRRDSTWTAAQAREEWDLQEEIFVRGLHGDGDESLDAFKAWLRETTISDAWELASWTEPPEAKAFVDRFMPRLCRVVADELAAERSASPGGHAA